MSRTSRQPDALPSRNAAGDDGQRRSRPRSLLSYHAAYDHCTAAYLEQAGARNTLIRLADIGVRGNGHMMMIEKNNAVIAGVIAQWLDRLRLRERQAGGDGGNVGGS
jgi:hypothetical protein